MPGRGSSVPRGPSPPLAATPRAGELRLSERRRLLVALVLTGRIAAEIDGLRRALGSGELDRIAPHITLVPPQNVPEPALAQVLAHLRLQASRAGPLRIRIGPAATFAPQHRVVYLAVADEDGELGALAGALSSGPLAPPGSRPARAFVPHVTVTNRATPELARAGVVALGAYVEHVTLDALSVLEADLDAPRHPWRPMSSLVLGGASVSGRGGFEVHLEACLPRDPELLAFIADEMALDPAIERELGGPAPEPVALTARVDGRVAGVAVAEVAGAVLELRLHLVGRALRGSGIGTRLLSALEGEARLRGCTEVRMVVPVGSAAAQYYLGRGYRERAVLPGAAGGASRSLLSRDLSTPDKAGPSGS